MTPDVITPDLKAVLRRLKLGRLLDTLPERLVLARQQQLPHQDFLLLALSDEVARRNSAAVTLRATQAQLDPTMTLEQWDPSAKVTYDRALWNELVSLRFIAAHAHVAIVGPVGVGKTFLAHALGWLACRHGHTVLATTADKMLKSLKHARVDHTYEQALRKLLAVDVLLSMTSVSTPSTRPRAAIPTRSSSNGTERGPSWSPRIAAPTSGSRPSPTPARAVGDRPLRQQRVRPGDRGRVLPQAPEADAGHAALTCGTERIQEAPNPETLTRHAGGHPRGESS